MTDSSASDTAPGSSTPAIPSLREVVLQALELHAGAARTDLSPLPTSGLVLVVGSGNAQATGRMLFDRGAAVFADESTLESVLERGYRFDAGVVLSASGGKHAPELVDRLEKAGIAAYLVTCNGDSPAARKAGPDRTVVSVSRPEPITYNTASYLGMLLGKTSEDPAALRRFLTETIEPLELDFRPYRAFYLLVPARFDPLREMFLTKFDELFGGHLNGRCFTPEQTLHAKTVVPWERELFLSFGWRNDLFGHPEHRLTVPLPEPAGYAAVMTVGYSVIGRIQEQFPPWFADHAEEYARLQPELFERYQGEDPQ